MRNHGADHPTYLALVLAVVAAIASMPHIGEAFQTMQSQPLANLFPEAASFAAAGPPQAVAVPP
jgi:hypothetical protein